MIFWIVASALTACISIWILNPLNKDLDIPKHIKKLYLIAFIVIFPLISLGIYLFIGSPDLKDHPWHARDLSRQPMMEAEQALLRERPLIKQLRKTPKDVTLWHELAIIYIGAGRLGPACQTLLDGFNETRDTTLQELYDTIIIQVSNAPMLNEKNLPECFQEDL